MSVLIDQKGFTKIGIKMLNEKLERVTSIPLLECNELGEESTKIVHSPSLIDELNSSNGGDLLSEFLSEGDAYSHHSGRRAAEADLDDRVSNLEELQFSTSCSHEVRPYL